jgi:hypothetical protein
MSLRWFKGPDGDPFQVQCQLGIHVTRLADKLHLEASPIKLNGVVVEFDSSTGCMFDTAFLADLGATRESANQVTGQPEGEPSANNFTWVNGLCVDPQARQASSHAAAADVSSRQCITCPTSSTLAWRPAQRQEVCKQSHVAKGSTGSSHYAQHHPALLCAAWPKRVPLIIDHQWGATGPG